MNGKKIVTGKERCQELSTFVSGGSTTKAQAVSALQASLKLHMQTKYSISSRIHFIKPIDSILASARDHSYVEYKFQQDYNENHEYMRRFYKKRETKDKILQLCEYFKYHYEIPRIFMESFIHTIDSFHDRRRHQIYQQVKQKIGKENIVGDESADEHKQGIPKQYYSLILKGMKLGPLTIAKAVSQPTATDTLQKIVGQLESARGNKSYEDLSITITDHFKEGQQSFINFLKNAPESDNNNLATVLRRHISSEKKTSKGTTEDMFQNLGINLQLKKQKKPTIVKVNPSLTRDIKGIKTIIGKALVEPKRSPRENIVSSARVGKLTSTNMQSGRHEMPDGSAVYKKSLATITNFRKEIEEFHLANTLSTRNKTIFKSFKEKGQLGTSNTKSISPKLNLLSSTRSGMESLKMLNSEASPKLRAKFLMHITKDGNAGLRVAPTNQLVTAKSIGNLNERSADKSTTNRIKNPSRERQRSGSNNWSSSNRVSIANLSTSPRDFILIKRIKTEETTEKVVERKPSGYSKFNVVHKKMSLGGHPSITSTAMDLKQSLHKQQTTSKPTGMTPSSKAFSSFRSRSKISSMNLIN